MKVRRMTLIQSQRKSDAGVGEVVKNKVTLPITCTSTYLDLYDIVDDDDVHGRRYIDCRKVKRNADASPCSDASTDVPDDEEYLTEWDEWSEVEKGRGPKASWSGEVWSTLSGEISRFSMATPGESTMIKNGKCVNVKNVKNIATDDDEYIPFPTMPCTSASNQSHRTKIPSGGLGSKLFNAMVSRPVGRAEIESNPKAKEAMLKEWKGLRDQEVFDFTMVREYDDVVAEAKKNKKGSTYGQGPWHMRGKELPAVRRQSWAKIQGKRRSARKSGEESALGGSILPRLGKFPCFLRSLTMGRFLRMSSWALRQVGRCDSGLHPG